MLCYSKKIITDNEEDGTNYHCQGAARQDSGPKKAEAMIVRPHHPSYGGNYFLYIPYRQYLQFITLHSEMNGSKRQSHALGMPCVM